MTNHETGYYWVRFEGDKNRWHIAYHNQYGWTLSYAFSSPNEGYRTNNEAKIEFTKIVGPIETPDNQPPDSDGKKPLQVS